jgi:hypothetical protein
VTRRGHRFTEPQQDQRCSECEYSGPRHGLRLEQDQCTDHSEADAAQQAEGSWQPASGHNVDGVPEGRGSVQARLGHEGASHQGQPGEPHDHEPLLEPTGQSVPAGAGGGGGVVVGKHANLTGM